ncbi:hypothetical protein Taro_031149 [Colocasia esculenta]|uniref:Uncharacterized protein n=1 Tax=Colocasia esculenta TaxID=4460 RepID=A0A843VTV9_COLES|nr:hypothetical protein [Colocasia esculenta]
MGRAPCCDKQGLRKGPWSPEEDKILVDYIQNNGLGSWRSLPKLAEMCSWVLVVLNVGRPKTPNSMGGAGSTPRVSSPELPRHDGGSFSWTSVYCHRLLVPAGLQFDPSELCSVHLLAWTRDQRPPCW